MSHHRRRAGLTRLDVAALLFVGFFATFVGCMGLSKSQETERAKLCAERISKLGHARFVVANRNGSYPGYLNVLQRNDGKPYVDRDTQQPVPVSWSVMVLPELDRMSLYSQWTKHVPEPFDQRNTVIDTFLCPREFDETPEEPFISYVVNTGMPDAPQATVTSGSAPGPPRIGAPRDWGANGMFFDNYTEHQLINTSSTNRGPMVYMSDQKVNDPKNRTILLTENVDATEYVIRGSKQAAENWKAVEVQMGCTWQVGEIDKTTKPPTMTPPSPSLRVNADAGKGDGTNYAYCRPSSRHPGGVVVCTVDLTAMALSDKISYFVYAKMMAPDDENVTRAGSPRGELIDPTFRNYQLSDADLKP
jgi:hypothetical protein